MNDDSRALEAHYRACWSGSVKRVRPSGGRSAELSPEFSLLVLPRDRGVRAYATVGMSDPHDSERLELHLLCRDGGKLLDEVVVIMAAVASYHRTGAPLGLGHSVNFGRPWLAGSSCSYGLISLPYLDGPKLEWLDSPKVRFLWLIPITEDEVAFKKEHGVEALEAAFEREQFDYLDPERSSVV